MPYAPRPDEDAPDDARNEHDEHDEHVPPPPRRHQLRRQEDRTRVEIATQAATQAAGAVQLVGTLNKVLPFALALLGFLGGRVLTPGQNVESLREEFHAYTRKQDLLNEADILRDTVSTHQRHALDAILTSIGRRDCRANRTEAEVSGFPCTTLLQDRLWPLDEIGRPLPSRPAPPRPPLIASVAGVASVARTAPRLPPPAPPAWLVPVAPHRGVAARARAAA